MEAEDQIRNLGYNILLGITIFMIFFIPATIIFITKFGRMDTKVISRLDRGDTFIILFTKTNCESCKKVKNELEDYNIDYEEIITDSERYYNTIIHKLEISKNDIIEPTIMYIEEGKPKSSLVNNKDNLRLYLEYNNLLSIE